LFIPRVKRKFSTKIKIRLKSLPPLAGTYIGSEKFGRCPFRRYRKVFIGNTQRRAGEVKTKKWGRAGEADGEKEKQ